MLIEKKVTKKGRKKEEELLTMGKRTRHSTHMRLLNLNAICFSSHFAYVKKKSVKFSSSKSKEILKLFTANLECLLQQQQQPSSRVNNRHTKNPHCSHT
jgi:hypothetical protein